MLLFSGGARQTLRPKTVAFPHAAGLARSHGSTVVGTPLAAASNSGGGAPNPRAQAIYRRHGFVAVRTAQVEDGVWEIRMVRRSFPLVSVDSSHRRCESENAAAGPAAHRS